MTIPLLPAEDVRGRSGGDYLPPAHGEGYLLIPQDAESRRLSE
jgi:hypothetical protein